MQKIRKAVVIAAVGAASVIGGLFATNIQYTNPAKFIVGHHQAGAAWTSRAQAVAHFKHMGYSDIAYSVLITPKGEAWAGRAEDVISGANKGLNTKTVSFCWLGNTDQAWPTDAQLVAAAAYVKSARVRHPGAKLIGHRDVWRIVGDRSLSTACPGKYGHQALRAVWLIVCGHSVQEAKRRALAGK